MFEEFGPANPPLPPAGALEQAMQRGKKIRRQRHAGIVSGLALTAVLIGGVALADPFRTNQGLVTPAERTGPPPDYSAIPEAPYTLKPAERANLDFGILSSVTTTNGITTLHVDRTVFYQGEEAQAHGAGDAEEWITRDPDGEGKVLTFTLDPKASIQAEASLRNDHDAGSQIRENLTPAELATNTDYVTSGKSDAGPTILVWLRHTGGPNGPVTALVDQFTP